MSPTAEKRQHQPRLNAYMPVNIVVPGQKSPAACAVREISPAGARLEIDQGWILPKYFWLRIVGDTGLHQCRVAWREGKTVGVEFPVKSSWWEHCRAAVNGQLPNRARL
jgi:hypothetical protein